MRVNLIILSLICTILFTTGCNTVPTPIVYDYQEQRVLQAAEHWNSLAQDVANKINNELIRNDFLNAAVYVKETCGDDATPCEQNQTTQFDEGFRDLLITQLVNFGIPTSTVIDRDVIVVDYKVQVIHHSDGRVPVPPTGMATGLTAAISVLRNAPAELIAITLAGAYDFYNNVNTLQSNYEVVITSSMVSKKKYIFRSSDIYYINDADFYHYRNHTGDSAEIRLTSHNSHPAPRKEKQIADPIPFELKPIPKAIPQQDI